MSRSPRSSAAIKAALQWARDEYGAEHAEILDRIPLEGGVSGANVERITVRVGAGSESHRASVPLVVKHTSRREVDALALLAELDEPSIPRLLASGRDDETYWLVIPWFPGEPVGLTAEAPASVGALMARIHAHFLARPAEWPSTFERIDSRFVDHALTEFAPASLERLPSTPDGQAFKVRAAAAAERLLADKAFREAAYTFPATVLHGDLYGLNVLREPAGAVMVIDWNTARIGPGMFDIAMGAPSEVSTSLLAYRAEWARIGGAQRPLDLEYDWSRALISTMFAGTVAQRSSIRDALAMLDVAEVALARLRGTWC